MESLIRAGAFVNVRDDPKTAIDSTSGYALLHAAAFFGNRSAAEVLLQHGAEVRAREERYYGTPASWANYAGHREVRDLILSGAIDLVEAVEFGLAERIPAMVAQDPSAVNRRFGDYPICPGNTESWYTPLALAVIRGHTATVRVLLEIWRGPDDSETRRTPASGERRTTSS